MAGLSFQISLKKYFELSTHPLKAQTSFHTVMAIMGFNADEETCDQKTAEFIYRVNDAKDNFLNESKTGEKKELLLWAATDNLANLRLMQRLGLVNARALDSILKITQADELAKGNLKAIPPDHLINANWRQETELVQSEATILYAGLELPNKSLLLKNNLLAKGDKIDIPLIRAAAAAIFNTSPSISSQDIEGILGNGKLDNARKAAISSILEKGGMSADIARAIVA